MPGVFRIRVQGRLDPRKVDRLYGLSLSESAGDETVIVGTLLDQADLAGVLGVLFDLHIPVISVERLADDRPRGSQRGE